MTTTLTPPPVSPGPPPASSPSSSGRIIAIVLIVIGAVIILGAVASAVFATVAAASARTTSTALAVDGVSDLDVDVSAGSLRIEFTDTREAELEVTSSWGLARWTLEREGDELNVASPQGFFNGGWLWGGTGDAVLRLPSTLKGIDADLGLSAGDLRVDAAFDEVNLEIGAGSADIQGIARDLDAQVSAGSVDLDLENAIEVSIGLSAGSMDAVFTGSQPRSIDAEVSAGSLDLTVPEGEYNVQSEVSAGDFDNRIDSTSDARSTIRVQLSAGSATLRAG
ncbi:hypothetical protein GCM10009775_15660 [Microbacterium aoyamense]|uniref:Adhesin domain-containing protein n=1 Tax=Microbacterium aoyamense TaxID=344166 RepID=A0ABN2PKH2_9MICO|nr:DUF4097 domain-containing protein [Microbacterium aoyamense]